MKSQIATVLHSVGTKLVLILLTAASTTVAALVIGRFETQAVSGHMTTLSGKELPAIRDGVSMIVATAEMRAELTDVMLAANPAELTEHHGHFVAQLTSTQDALAQMSPTIRDTLKPLLEQMADQMAAPVAARLAAFDRQAEVRQRVEALTRVSARIDAELARQQLEGQTELQALGEQSSAAVAGGLRQLVEGEFASIAVVLQTRSDLSALSGTVISLGLQGTPSEAAKLQAAGLSALDQLAAEVRQMKQDGSLVAAAGSAAELLGQATTLLREHSAAPAIIGQTATAAATTASASNAQLGIILDKLDAVDKALTAAQQLLLTRVADLASQTVENDRTVLSALVASQVGSVQRSFALNTAIRHVVGASYQAALTDTEAALADIEKLAAEQNLAVAQMLQDHDPAMAPMIQVLLDLTSIETGIVMSQRTYLTAQKQVAVAVWHAEELLSAGVDQTVELAHLQLDSIEQLGTEIIADGRQTESLFLLTAVISAAILLVMPFVSYLFVVRPLSATARATTRLAQGDMAAVDGLKQSRGEVGAMVAALGVFRDNLVEKARLEQEESANQAKRIEAERLATQHQAAQVARETAQQAEQDQRQRDMEAAEAAKRDEMRRAADAERQAREAVQTMVVTELANGLRRLAQGDLRAKIEMVFSEGYDPLRLDFNAAVATLKEVIGSIRTSVESIHGGSDEISRATADLSRRTEKTAAMLEQSAAALTELTASVESAADGAGEAARIVETARGSAEASGSVVREAVQTMGAIEQSSRKISTIVSVIDDIAFQTNLLALNAGVEAARAGEAGRGFAVVASEVRALSQRSSDAAREIADLISESGRQVTRGVGLVGKTGDALRDIVRSVVEISRHVSTIAASAREQSTGISEINTAIALLDQATQQNAAMVEETTAASMTLAGEASQLSRTVAHFTIGEGREVRAGEVRAGTDDGGWGAELATATAA